MEAIISKVGTLLLSQYGLLGIIVVVLGLYILKKEKDQKEDRADALKTMNEDRDAALKSLTDLTERAIASQDRNTQVLAEVRTLIETIARR